MISIIHEHSCKIVYISRIGSDEDDEDADDESQSNEDPSETAVSINAKMVVINGEDFEEDDSVKPDVSTKADGASGKQETVSSKQDVPKKEDVGVAAESEGQGMSGDQGDADQGASSGKAEQNSTEYMNGDVSRVTL